MHCLGAVSSVSASPQRAGNCGGVLGVVRALGVLVSEGRVQGPPKGYKEGPHCAAPLQPVPKNHVCVKDNYLCDRYVILVREIADRVTACSYLCFEVLLCTDCPCGSAKATSKDPVSPITATSMSIVPWPHSSEMLLEYWCISVVPSRGPEMMNNQSLYQAVRSRLHFSQVAAWWSRSKGTAPSYIATRVVSFSEDNLRKFRETPSEHTFPLAACGDGNSIKVTVWALPRVEDVPVLNCPIHPASENHLDDGSAARALTPTKNIPLPATRTNLETLVLPTLVDDRLQTPCNEPGKHHCRCEEEDGCPPSPSLRANGERKRRRSLPRGPDCIPTAIPHNSTTAATSVLPSVFELAAGKHENRKHLNGGGSDCTGTSYNETRYSASGINCPNPDADADADCGGHRQIRSSIPSVFYFEDEQSGKESLRFVNRTNTNAYCNGDADLEKTYGSQVRKSSNVEKRYKRDVEPTSVTNSCRPSWDRKARDCRLEKSPKFDKKDCLFHLGDKTDATAESELPMFGINEKPTLRQSSLFTTASPVCRDLMADVDRMTGTISGKQTESGSNKREKLPPDVSLDTLPISHSKANLVVNPFGESSPFHESNPGPSTYASDGERRKFQTPFVSLFGSRTTGDRDVFVGTHLISNGISNQPVRDTKEEMACEASNDLSQLMSNLTFPEKTDKTKDDKRILDWLSKVPSRVLNAATINGFTGCKSKIYDGGQKERNNSNEAKSKLNCNLELSQREFDEVLAVLRSRTPTGRRRAPLRTIKRREKLGKQTDECIDVPRADVKERTAPNPNAFYHPVYNNVHNNKTVITDRLGIAKVHSNGYDASPRVGKNLSKSAALRSVELSSWIGQGELGNCGTANEKNNRSEKPETPEKQGAKPDDCSRNVTNKADLLLGAILRTSKDPRKGFPNIPNSARPRMVLSGENCDGQNYAHFRDAEKPAQKVGQVKPFEDVRLLSSSFKHADNPEHTSDVSEIRIPREPAFSLRNSHESRVKRRIDFSNFSGTAHWSGDQNESLPVSGERHFGTNSVYQKPLSPDVHDPQKCLRMKIREHSSLTIKEDETVGEEGPYVSSNTVKHSTNLRLQIGRKEIENDRENRDSVFPRKEDSSIRLTDDVEKKEHQRYEDLEENEASDRGVPSAIEQERFRRSFGNAASMVFHSRTGLPLTSSPAPLRRGSCCFDYDSSLNSVSSKRSALFELNTPPSPGAVSLEEGDREAECACDGDLIRKRRTPSRGAPHSHALLGSFEESALNGRLEPVSTVHGFTAELGASGSFCPKHRKLPVTVFFYTLGDNDKVSTPYLAHINLGRKGYQVPRSGTIQVTLLNPLGTVVKMFVVMYDLSDMPSRSHTFLRQRTLRDKTLRYLIHLRFMSGKSGRIYLHTDIRMIICRKTDVDTASDLGAEPPKELRSFVHGPTNPKFSPRC